MCSMKSIAVWSIKHTRCADQGLPSEEAGLTDPKDALARVGGLALHVVHYPDVCNWPAEAIIEEHCRQVESQRYQSEEPAHDRTKFYSKVHTCGRCCQYASRHARRGGSNSIMRHSSTSCWHDCALQCLRGSLRVSEKGLMLHNWAKEGQGGGEVCAHLLATPCMAA